jgi:hypothetical protein
LLFLALAVVFVALTVRDYLIAANVLTPARRTWLRVALIFSAITAGLVLLNALVG